MSSDKYLNTLVDTLLKVRTKKEMLEFLEGILTPRELIELPTRLEIVKQLKNGASQHKIAETLGVGVATVTRGSKELQKGKFKNI